MGMFDNMKPPTQKRVCFLVRRCDELKLADKDRETLFGLLDDVAVWSASALTAELNKRGFVVSRGVIDRHRAQNCPCWDK